MTSEVAVLTRHAVALAADSAVTTAGPVTGAGVTLKIFNTVNKVFALSKYQPVGIMIYNSANIMGVPAETVVKGFRRRRKKQSCHHLEEYAEAFEVFLRSDDWLFSPEARRLSLAKLARACTATLCEATLERLRPLSAAWGHPTEAEAQGAFEAVLAEFEQIVNGSPTIALESIPEARAAIANAIGPEIQERLDWLQALFPLGADAETRVRELVTEQFVRDVQFGGETGFVVAGFGTQDVFPRLRSFEFSYSALAAHKVRHPVSVDISETLLGHIQPFAQIDVMETFVEGMDPSYRDFLPSFLDAFFEEKRDQLQAINQVQVAAFIESVGAELGQKLQEKLGTMRQRAFIEPLMQVVSSMPKEDLALLAEALVNLTALKRRASPDAETVGGPTDVAVISRGDGFIWIKRKHYFDPAFNPGFAARYLEEDDDG